MTQVRRAPLADQAADLLLARIQAGEWSLGQKLPGESVLGPQLGVGRSTLREAIRQLAGRGVLASRQGSGVYVTALDAPQDWDAVVRRADLAPVLEARIAIEAESAALAAARRTPAQLREIRACLDRRARDAPLDEHVDDDLAFHRSVIAAAGNPILAELFDGFTPRVRQAMLDLLRARRDFDSAADHDAHARLAEAIAARRPDEAARLSRTHLESLKEGLA